MLEYTSASMSKTGVNSDETRVQLGENEMRLLHRVKTLNMWAHYAPLRYDSVESKTFRDISWLRELEMCAACLVPKTVSMA